MPETTPLIKAALNLRVGAGFDVYGLSYDPESIIFEDMDYDILDDRPDLLEYLEEYEKRTSGVQMTLWDLFPEAM